jgi:hypothetical protein
VTGRPLVTASRTTASAAETEALGECHDERVAVQEVCAIEDK